MLSPLQAAVKVHSVEAMQALRITLSEMYSSKAKQICLLLVVIVDLTHLVC